MIREGGPSVGEILRRARVERGISLQQVEAALKVRLRYLQALETDDFPSLPPTVYTRALVRGYARFLGLSPAEMLEHSIPMRVQDRNPIRPALQPLDGPPLISWKAISAVGALTLCAGLFMYLYVQYSTLAESLDVRQDTGAPAQPTNEGRTIAARLTPFATAGPPATPTVAMTPITGIVVDARITERVWLQVWADGRSVFAETLTAGAGRTFSADQSIRMRVGNAGGVDVTANGVHQGRLGTAGQVLDASWGRE